MQVRKILIGCLLSGCLASLSHAQDIPLFSQNLTNSFIYNPAVAGHDFGSITLAHRSSFASVNNAAKSNFLSFHTPIQNYKFGVGANVFFEQVNFFQNIYGSAAFAYHIPLGGYNTLSMGVSGEYNNISFDPGRVIGATDDEVLQTQNESGYDFSFGLNYHHKYFQAGISANRLATSFIATQNATLLSGYYSAYASGIIPLRDDQDVLRPSLTFRKFSQKSNVWDAGIYYTINNMILVGAAYRAGDILNLTAGFKFVKKFLLGYSFELVNNNLGRDLGSTSEVTLRFDFGERDPQTMFRSDYKNSMAYRRKTLSRSSSARKRVGIKGPRALKKKSKKAAKYSPNRRYTHTSKLKTTKLKSSQKRKKYRRNKKRRGSKNRRYR